MPDADAASLAGRVLVVSGAGTPQDTEVLVTALQPFPTFARRVSMAIWAAPHSWVLRLDNDNDVMLPINADVQQLQTSPQALMAADARLLDTPGMAFYV